MSEGDYASDAAAAAPPPRFNPVVRPAGDARQEWKEMEADIQRRGQQLFKAATAMKKFNPSSKDGSDWRRFDTEFSGIVNVAGPDFFAAMMSKRSDIPVARTYPEASVIDDSAGSVYSAPLPHLRQQLLLSALRAALDPEGEPARIIAPATQMGGVVKPEGAPAKRQAWRLLLDRYV